MQISASCADSWLMPCGAGKVMRPVRPERETEMSKDAMRLIIRRPIPSGIRRSAALTLFNRNEPNGACQRTEAACFPVARPELSL